MGEARRRAGCERGQSFALFLVIAGVAIFPLLAFVVDIGDAMELKRHLQSSADAAALAAAQDLPAASTAKSTAIDYSAGAGGKNERVDGTTVSTDVCFPAGPTCPDAATTADLVRVTQSAKSEVFFAGWFGFDGFDISATAVARRFEEPVQGSVLVFANSDGCDADDLRLNGGDITVDGGLRSNGGMSLNGGGITFDTASAACPHQGDSEYTDDVVVDADPIPWPFTFSFPGDFPGGYCSDDLTGQVIVVNNAGVFVDGDNVSATIEDGVYCAEESFQLGGDPKTAQITVLAPRIQIGGDDHELTAFDATRRLLFFVTSTTGGGSCPPTNELQIGGNGSLLAGRLYNPCGSVLIDGNDHDVDGSLVGQQVRVNGNDIAISGGGEQTTGSEEHVELVE